MPFGDWLKWMFIPHLPSRPPPVSEGVKKAVEKAEDLAEWAFVPHAPSLPPVDQKLTDLFEWMFIPHLPTLPPFADVELTPEDYERLQYVVPAMLGMVVYWGAENPYVVGEAIKAIPETVKAVASVVPA